MEAVSAIFSFLIVLAVLATLGVLIVGVFSMLRRERHDPRFSNKLMCARVVVQAAAVLLIALFFLLFRA
ncbi:MAG: twin transmembrane helix small protein [Alphaproteobacteria bacterium]